MYEDTSIKERFAGTKANKEGFMRLVFTHQGWDGMTPEHTQQYVNNVLSVMKTGSCAGGDPLLPITQTHVQRLEGMYGLAEKFFCNTGGESGKQGDNMVMTAEQKSLPSSGQITRGSILSQLLEQNRHKAKINSRKGGKNNHLSAVCIDSKTGSLLPDVAKCMESVKGIDKLVHVETILSIGNCVVTVYLVDTTGRNMDMLHQKLMGWAKPISECNIIKEQYAQLLKQKAFFQGCMPKQQ